MRNCVHAATVLLLLNVLAPPAQSQPSTAVAPPTDSTPRVRVGGFVDTYYAWDFGRPPSRDRSFAGGAVFGTQSARHNEFNVNLAFVDLSVEAPHYRGRLAIQAGTSVQSNYAGEPSSGTVSGPALSRLLQEAIVGVQLAPTLWVDGGVFLSHMGMESWISRDNPTYTRSLVADYSPYYQSGAKLTWTPKPSITAQLDVVNGWQNIAENNNGKGAGIRVDWTSPSWGTLSYYNVFTPESGTRLRTLHGVGLRHARGATTVLAEADVGSQSRKAGASSNWYGGTAALRRQTSERVALSLRVEAFRDADQVVIATGSVDGVNNPAFRGFGGSVGIDVAPYAHVTWRSELRLLRASDALFPAGPTAARRENALAVTSLALTF